MLARRNCLRGAADGQAVLHHRLLRRMDAQGELVSLGNVLRQNDFHPANGHCRTRRQRPQRHGHAIAGMNLKGIGLGNGNG